MFEEQEELAQANQALLDSMVSAEVVQKNLDRVLTNQVIWVAVSVASLLGMFAYPLLLAPLTALIFLAGTRSYKFWALAAIYDLDLKVCKEAVSKASQKKFLLENDKRLALLLKDEETI
ncbi:MAG: hypothetical protein L3J47_00045 [Sulfurovum sp.]|nr:hypothetical protein [Sulfurovum sp.]